jgi:hypothetical protein
VSKRCLRTREGFAGTADLQERGFEIGTGSTEGLNAAAARVPTLAVSVVVTAAAAGSPSLPRARVSPTGAGSGWQRRELDAKYLGQGPGRRARSGDMR